MLIFKIIADGTLWKKDIDAAPRLFQREFFHFNGMIRADIVTQ